NGHARQDELCADLAPPRDMSFDGADETLQRRDASRARRGASGDSFGADTHAGVNVCAQMRGGQQRGDYIVCGERPRRRPTSGVRTCRMPVFSKSTRLTHVGHGVLRAMHGLVLLALAAVPTYAQSAEASGPSYLYFAEGAGGTFRTQ